jgi:hypothetical protein
VARIVPVQTNFTAGEFSPRLLGREDIQRYSAAVATLDNFRVMPHGGATRRPGRHFVAECYNSTTKSRLMPFEHDVTTAYILELANIRMRVFKNSGIVESVPGVPFELATDYLEADLFELQSAQSADVMYIAHKNYWPRKLSRTSDIAWTLSQVSFTDGPYLPDNTTTRTMLVSAVGPVGAAITITASSSYFRVGMGPVGTEPGGYIRIKNGAVWGYAQITNVTSTTLVTAVVKSVFGAVAAVTTWAEGAWSKHRGFPRSVTFFEQRLYFGGTSYQAQTLWGSASGFYEDFTPGTADSSAVNYTIASQALNTIQWLKGGDVLFIGTAGAEYVAGDPSTALTPTNVRISPQTAHGSAYMQPLEVSSVLLFLTRSNRKVREMQFEFKDNAYRAPDLTLLAEHITKGGIVQMSHAKEPDSTVYAVRGDGMLLNLTYDREQEIVAWGTESCAGLTESVATIPAIQGAEGYNQTWTITNYTIGGVTKRYVEYFQVPFDEDDGIESAFFVDSGLQYDGAPTLTLSGLGHLEGETVAICGDGAVFTSQVVTAGAVSVSPAVSKASVGLPYTSTLKTLPGITGAPDGSTQGRAKSWGRCKLRVYQTVGLKTNGVEIQFRSASDPMDTATQPYTGVKEVQLLGWDEEAQITYTQDDPLPATILALFGTLQVEDM